MISLQVLTKKKQNTRMAKGYIKNPGIFRTGGILRTFSSIYDGAL